ncbi:protein germ cell-less-like [Macrosteles quadrilineatus]|uniref:protein germ cell-less-like n=1 Tax=Macrosteles quadrilineatus TaxID=74068 RepID=UPI0023E246E3|nr:protein germ cell-less-like [Macrosteles quadrilineatus]
MGESMSKFVSQYAPVSVTEAYNRISHKRKRMSSLEEEDETNLEESLHSPKKRKLTCTTQYIYKALFVDGRNSDVVVDALGKEWRLHKVYLTQSPYFQSMFSGSWKETDNKYIRIEIADPNITLDSLKVVLGSLYQDEVSIEPADVVGVLAAATMFQLDGLIDQCLCIMVETISPLTATSYYEAASQYGLQRIRHATVKWFLTNLMTYYPSHAKRLRQIEPDLMAVLVQDKDLVVVQTEFCLYWLLRFWVFLRLHPHWTHDEDGCTGSDSKQVTEFFHQRPDKSAFLVSPEGKDYLRVFQGLHIGSLITQVQDLRTLTTDRLLPEVWLYPVLTDQWASLLCLDSGKDRGPEKERIGMDKFFSSCVRCGRVLESKDNHTWKWKVFNFGLDLVWSTFNNMLTVRRASDDAPLSYNGIRNVMLRVTLATLDKQRQTKLSQSSGVISVMLVRNHEVKVMDLCPDFDYPLIVSVCLLSVTPQPSTSTSV